MRLLVLRPEPGATATARAAATLGLTAIVAPLFAIQPLAWSPPDPAGYDALMVTSANAVRFGGAALRCYAHLPAFAVGAATADAMRLAGFADVAVGAGDADRLAALIAAGPHRRLLHPCGEHRRAPAFDGAIDHLPVYRSAPVGALPDAARDVAATGAAALLHSPRAATLFGTLIDAGRFDRAATHLVAISAAAATAAGPGWRSVSVAPIPRDAAVLATARALCEKLGA